MLFGGKKNIPEPAPAKSGGGEGAAPANAAVLSDVLDAFASVIRALGRHACDLGEVKEADFNEQCEKWARHMLVGAPKPNDPVPVASAAPPAKAGAGPESGGAATVADAASRPVCYPLPRRGWREVLNFVVERRRQEKELVTHSLGSMKNIVIDSLTVFRKVVSDDQDADKCIHEQLVGLHDAVQSNSLERVREQVTKTSGLISEMLIKRKASQEQQMAELRKQIRLARSELLEMQRELEEDPLTRVYNRRAFDRAFEKFVTFAGFVGDNLSLMVIDLDNFKGINDTLGHLAGDEVLRCVGRALPRAFPRKSDFIARIGGDEFVVLMPETDAETATKMGGRCVAAFESLAILWNEQPLRCSCSVGVATMKGSETAAEFFHRADAALYRAKAAGRNRSEVATES